jgi:glycolate oxidase FAD binding subunit
VTALRPALAEDAILGVAPRSVVEPDTVEEAAEAMKACARDRLRVAIVGGGTDLGVGAPPTGVEVVLRTGRLARVVEHSPSDQIVVAEAGLPLAVLQRTLAAHGQRLALDPPFAERATVGGVVAANAFGPRRTRYGTARDLIIGLSMVRADGAVAKGGGKVVKNVAGFDLPRLFVGSLGTLGLITTVTFRLHPLPEASATVTVDQPTGAQVRAVVVAVREAQLDPTSVTLLAGPEGLSLGVRFEGFGPGVRQQAERLTGLGSALGLRFDLLEPAGAEAFWARHEAARTSGAVRVRLAAPRSAPSPAGWGRAGRCWTRGSGAASRAAPRPTPSPRWRRSREEGARWWRWAARWSWLPRRQRFAPASTRGAHPQRRSRSCASSRPDSIQRAGWPRGASWGASRCRPAVTSTSASTAASASPSARPGSTGARRWTPRAAASTCCAACATESWRWTRRWRSTWTAAWAAWPA